MNSRRHQLVVGGLFAAGLALAGCGPTAAARSVTPAPASAGATVPPVGAVGAPVTAGGVAFTVHGVERRASYTGSVGQRYRAREGYVFLLLDVEVGAPGRDQVSPSSAFVTLRDGAGFTYQSEGSRAGRSSERGLSADYLARGERTRGLVPYEVPVAVADAGGLVATYGGVLVPGGVPLPLRVRVDIPA